MNLTTQDEIPLCTAVVKLRNKETRTYRNVTDCYVTTGKVLVVAHDNGQTTSITPIDLVEEVDCYADTSQQN